MIQNTDYVLKYICGTPHLFTIGQANANLEGDLIIDEFGAFISSRIKNGADPETVLEACYAEYAESEEEKPIIKSYFEQYTGALRSRGILFDSYENRSYYKEMADYSFPIQKHETEITYIKIANLFIRLDCPKSAVPIEFDKFISDCPSDSKAKIQNIAIRNVTGSEVTENLVSCKRLIDTYDITLHGNSDYLFFSLPKSEYIESAKFCPDFSQIEIDCKCTPESTAREDIFCLMRIAFLAFAEQNGLFAIHSSSILYRNRLWLFSAMSGVGKTTHANLWKDNLGVPVFNGDLNLVGFDSTGNPVVYGLPWCGTSEVSTVGEHPLGGIIYIKQAPEDFVENLSPENKITLLLHRIVSPMWTEKMLDSCINFAEKLQPQTYISRLNCTPNVSAMNAIKEEIDKT